MKKIICLFCTFIILISCNTGKSEITIKDSQSNNSISDLNAKKAEYSKKINELNLELDKINEAIKSLGGDEKRTLITAFEVKKQPFEHEIEVQANIKTRQNVLIFPEFSGRLIEIKVTEGQKVKKGKLLAVIDDAGLKSQLDQMKLELSLAKTSYNRTKRLWEQKIGSEMMYLESRTRYKGAQKQVAQMRKQLARTKIYAPFDGIIDEISGRLGSNLVPGVTPVLRIVNLDNMFAESDVPENYIPNIRVGSKATVTIPALNQSQKTEIKKTGNFVTASNRTFRVEAPLKNPNGFIKPNLNAKLNIIDYFNPEALTIPLRVLREDSNGQVYVFVLIQPEEKDGYTTEKRNVKLGKSKNEIVEILKGITVGELIVDDGVNLLVDNQKVKRIIE